MVSALLFVLVLYPGGNDGDMWLSATFRVSPGNPSPSTRSSPKPQAARAAIAQWLFTWARANDACTQQGLASDSLTASFIRDAFAPTLQNYKYTALTASGLAVGLDQGRIHT